MPTWHLATTRMRNCSYHEPGWRHEESGGEEEGELEVLRRGGVSSRHEFVDQLLQSSGRHAAVFVVDLESNGLIGAVHFDKGPPHFLQVALPKRDHHDYALMSYKFYL